jgi:predicted ATPase
LGRYGPGFRRPPGGLTRFVGRDVELEQLRQAQNLAVDGHGQVVALVAEAGVGKSRLAYELTHSQSLEGWLVLEAAGVSYGKAMSYLPVVNLLKSYFEVQDRDSLQAIGDKVAAKILALNLLPSYLVIQDRDNFQTVSDKEKEKLLALDRALQPTLPGVLALLDVPVNDAAWQMLDPSQRRRRMLDAVRHLLLRETRQQPLLLIFEDLHWIDGRPRRSLTPSSRA